MLQKTFYISLIVTVVMVLAVLLSLPTPSSSSSTSTKRPIDRDTSSNQALLITNVNLFNGEKFEGPLDIEIQNGLVQKVSTKIAQNGQRLLEGRSRVVIPGLIDAHTHTFGDGLSSALNFGVTSQIDMFSSSTLLPMANEQRADRTQNTKADLYSAGMLATVDRGHGTQFGVDVETINSSTNIDEWLERRINEGSDFVKIVYMPYIQYFESLDRATAAKIIKLAHQKNLKVVAHISSLRAANELLEDDIDGFVHIFADEVADPAFIKQAKEKGIFIVPTLSVIASVDHMHLGTKLATDPAIEPFLSRGQTQQLKTKFGEQSIPGFDFDVALQNTKLLYQAGVPILAGSDAPNPGTSYGASLHQEIELLQLAGMSLEDALSSATFSVAKSFGIENIGMVTEGAKADFVILNTDKLEDIKSIRNIDQIYKNGKLVNRTSVYGVDESEEETPGDKVTGLAEHKTEESVVIQKGSLSQFEQGLDTDTGFTWSKTDDGMSSGKSHAEISLEDNVLNVETTVNAGFIFPWAGASGFAQSPRDISRFKQLQFTVRGSEGEYRLMIFTTSTAGAPASQTFKVKEQWSEIRLALDDFKGVDTHNFIGLAIVSGPEAGTFKYQLDDVKLLP